MSLQVKTAMAMAGTQQGLTWGGAWNVAKKIGGTLLGIPTGNPQQPYMEPAPNMPPTAGMPVTVATAANGAACAKPCGGYHLNKSSYYRRDENGQVVFIQKGTVWIKNRRRNPNNPRANSRAMARLTSAKNAQKNLSRVTIRKKNAAPARRAPRRRRRRR